MSFITKKLEEFDKRFPNSPINWSFVSSDIRAFLSTALDEMIKEVEKGLPKYQNKEFAEHDLEIAQVPRVIELLAKQVGFNNCLNKIKQSLSSLREGNK